MHDLGKGETPAAEWPRHIAHEARSERLGRALNARLRVATDVAELALLTAREHTHVHASAGLDAAAVLRLLERCDALRRPARFLELLQACECDATGRAGFAEQPYPPRERLARALAIAQGVDAHAAAQAAQDRGQRGPAIARAIASARTAALAAALDRPSAGPCDPG